MVQLCHQNCMNMIPQQMYGLKKQASQGMPVMVWQVLQLEIPYIWEGAVVAERLVIMMTFGGIFPPQIPGLKLLVGRVGNVYYQQVLV